MSREEFEAWLSAEHHARIDEAVDRLPKNGDRSIEKWMKLFASNLLEVAQEESAEPEEETEEDAEEDDLDTRKDDIEED